MFLIFMEKLVMSDEEKLKRKYKTFHPSSTNRNKSTVNNIKAEGFY